VSPEVTLFSDLSDVDHDGRVFSSLRFLEGRLPEVGEVVLLTDGEGSSCLGRVVSIDEKVILIDPDWDSWEDEPRLAATGRGTSSDA
jgi:hypothetical protein